MRQPAMRVRPPVATPEAAGPESESPRTVVWRGPGTRTISPSNVLRLQRLAGNCAVVRNVVVPVQRAEIGEMLGEARDLIALGAQPPTVGAGDHVRVQRKVTADMLQAAATLANQVLPGQNVIVVPRAMSVGTAENPAICVKKAITKNWVKTQMGQPNISKDVDAGVNWPAIINSVDTDTIVIHEGAFSGTQALKAAIVWHECGHIAHGASENGDVYLHEVQHLWNNRVALGAEEVKKVVEDRANKAYGKAVNPNRDALANFLKLNWGIEI